MTAPMARASLLLLAGGTVASAAPLGMIGSGAAQCTFLNEIDPYTMYNNLNGDSSAQSSDDCKANCCFDGSCQVWQWSDDPITPPNCWSGASDDYGDSGGVEWQGEQGRAPGPAPGPAPPAQNASWHIGAMGESCTDTCQKAGSACSTDPLWGITGTSSIEAVATQLGLTCTDTDTNSYAIPYIDGKPSGTCYYNSVSSSDHVACTDSHADRARFCKCGGSTPAGFEPCTTRPTIGSNVTVHSSDPASTCSAPYLNRFGIITSDDHDSRPYRIRFNGSIPSCYFRVSELWCSSTPPPPPGFEACTTRPTVGFNVTVHSSDPASTCSAPYLNRFGIITSDDHDSRPYKIRFNGSIPSCYFRVSELWCALKQPPPPPPPGFEPCTTRPTIGSNVTVHSIDPDDSGNCVADHLNRFGIIYTDDRSTRPYQINFDGVRDSCWFRESEVWCAIHQGPPPPGPPLPCCKEICDSKNCGTTCPICQGTGGGVPGNTCNGCGAGVPCQHCGGTSSCNQTLGMTCDSARLEGLVACGICVGKNYDKLASVGCSEPSFTDAFCRNQTCTPSLFAQCKTSRDKGELECATCIGQRDAEIPAVCALPEEQAFCGTGSNSSDWHVGDKGQSCDTVCQNMGGACSTEAQWGITSSTSIRAVARQLGLTCTSTGTNVYATPYIDDKPSGTCYYASGGDPEHQPCSNSDSDRARFCKCTGGGGGGGNSSLPCCGTWCQNTTNTRTCMGSCQSHVANNCGTHAQYPVCGPGNTECSGCEPGPGCAGHCDSSC